MERQYTWDPAKASSNLAKHGVSFEAAAEAFDDPGHVVVENDHTEEELRYVIIGMTTRFVLIAAIFVDRSEPDLEVIRIISARKAVAFEESIYEDSNG